MRKIIPRDLVRHLEWKPGDEIAPVVDPVVSPVGTSGYVDFPSLPTESFLMCYDGPHGEFFQELITKVNETYSGTKAEIPVGTSGEIQGNLVKRMGLISTIAGDSSLRSRGLYPITAEQSEYLLKEGRLTNPGSNWEDLAMVLYDRSENGRNPKEAQALYDSLKAHRQDLNLGEADLEKRLVVVNAGGEVDSSMPHGVRPIIVPGITQVYTHEVLETVGTNSQFEGYGLNGGLPLKNQLNESGSRTLFMPDETEDIGARVLYRVRDHVLGARYWVLAYSRSDGRVTFARSVAP